MPYLKAKSVPSPGERFDLDKDVVTIGRHPDCEIILTGPGTERISRQHAQIIRQGTSFYVKDLGSRNGTFLNDERVGAEPQLLTDRDRVAACDVLFDFRVGGTTLDRPIPTISEPGPEDPFQLTDEESDTSSGSTIMSKVDVATSSTGMFLRSTLEARMAALIEITRNLGRALALDEVLPQVLDSLFKIFLQADRGFIVLKTDDDQLVPRWRKARKEEAEDTIRISRSIITHVMNTREAILSEDLTQNSPIAMTQSIADARIRSVMCAPLLDTQGNPMGALQLDTLDVRKQFQKEDLDVLASVAAQAGIAVDNAQMHERAVHQAEIEKDLEVAREVQKAFLPRTDPKLDEYEFYSYYEPASHVGGDYFGYIALPDDRMAVVVADVVGHGVAAAMMVMRLTAEMNACLAVENRAAAAITELNNRISSVEIDRFFTLVMVILDMKTHEATIVSAGHMAPIWRRVDGTIEEPGTEETGLPVGIMEGWKYEQSTIQLAPGESLTMYTDGINEAMDTNDKQYSIERLRQHIKADTGGWKAVHQEIITDVRQHIGAGSQEDDMCLVSIFRKDA